MKKLLLFSSLTLSMIAPAQFSSGTVNLSDASMTVKLDTNTTTATITLTGDSNSMLGIGFGTSGMANGSDGFIFNSSSNRDYTFTGFSNPSADPVQNWTETSNTVTGSTRTVVATRTLAGGPGDFAIPNAAGTINIYYARSEGSTGLGYHSQNRGYETLNMAPTLGTSDFAEGSKKSMIYPNPAKEILYFKNPNLIEFIEVFDVTGKKLKSLKFENQRINISKLSSGIYYLEINFKDKTQSVERLVKE